MSEAAEAALIGRQVGDYRITDRLGAGAMGVVYKASDLKLNRAVALKFLPPEVSGSARDKERFLREAQAASALDHPNVGTIYGIEETDDGQSYIVMAFYDGETLQSKIRRGALPMAQAVDFTMQIAQGLSAAHAKGIVHRDVKPGNVMVTSQGLVKVLDFGLARMPSSGQTTETAAICGTVPYMSPEQALNRKLDARSDIFSLGIVLNEMVTGQLPFHAHSAPATLFAIVNAAPEAVDKAPAPLRPIIYRALAKDPADRYPDLQEMIGELKGLQSSPDLPTRTMEGKRLRDVIARAAGVRPGGGSSGRRRWLLGAGIVAAAVAGVLAVSPWVRTRVAEMVTPRPNHIAVLPFTSLGKDVNDEALSEGLVEMLTGRLSNLESADGRLWVVPASEVRRRKVNDAAAARREFGANLVVTGTVQKSASGVRLTVNLVDAAEFRQLGSAIVDDKGGDYSALQDGAVARLAKLLKLQEHSGRAGGPGADVAPAAYESYLKGVGYLRRYDKAGSLDAAIAAFEESESRDPKSALALAGLGEAYWTKYLLDKDAKWIDRAIDYCRRASAMDDQLAPVFITLGSIHNATGKPELALQEFQRALELDSRNAAAFGGEANAFEILGRVAEAESTYKRSAALRPDYWDGYNKLGLFYFRQRRFAEAAPEFRHAIELTPDNWPAYVNLGAAYERLGKLDQAAASYRKSIQLNPTYAGWANLGNIYAMQENWTAAVQAREKALQLNDKDYRVWANLGNAYVSLHQEAKAREAYGKALGLAQKAVELNPRKAESQAGLAPLYAKLGMREQALAAIETSLALAPDDASVMETVADTYEILGDREHALYWVGKHLEKGGSVERLRRNVDMRALIADPRFKAAGH